ncbi:hypothetical protein [Vreelandella neptunia]|uniref:Uncharacterized protein n=1 Tax=Vreelandella neptunia TaxID=115551 RepID=A0ABS9SC99_9GAMM|nr:hypothetical protein [Halomonas neptunia]MCH4813735.1 hypothetical protein [Halomonas neptunia]
MATSLLMQAQIHIVHGKSLIFPQPPVITDHSMVTTTLPAILRARDEKHELQQQALFLFKELKQILDDYTKPQARVTAKSMEQLVTQRSGKLSSAITLLVIWIVSVIRMGKGRTGRRSKSFENSNIHNYWGALCKLLRSWRTMST